MFLLKTRHFVIIYLKLKLKIVTDLINKTFYIGFNLVNLVNYYLLRVYNLLFHKVRYI